MRLLSRLVLNTLPGSFLLAGTDVLISTARMPQHLPYA